MRVMRQIRRILRVRGKESENRRRGGGGIGDGDGHNRTITGVESDRSAVRLLPRDALEQLTAIGGAGVPPVHRFYSGKRVKFSEGEIGLGYLWYPNFWVPDALLFSSAASLPPPPPKGSTGGRTGTFTWGTPGHCAVERAGEQWLEVSGRGRPVQAPPSVQQQPQPMCP